MTLPNTARPSPPRTPNRELIPESEMIETVCSNQEACGPIPKKTQRSVAP
jgi:hypothetical protein